MGDNEVINEVWFYLMVVDDLLEFKGIQKLIYYFLFRYEYRCILVSFVFFFYFQRQGFCVVEKVVFLIYVYVVLLCFNDVVCMYVKKYKNVDVLINNFIVYKQYCF